MTMKKGTFELLPNELLLIIFSYLSSFDLCQTFLHLNNARIQYLVTSIRHSLDVSLMQYNQLHQWLNNSQDHIIGFTSLIDTLVLHNSCACFMLIKYWKKTFNGAELINILFPSIKRLFLLNAEWYPYVFFRPILIPLVFNNHTLQYLHLIFEHPTHSYSLILSELVVHRISVRTMILEVEQGHTFYWKDEIKGLHNMEPLCWPNTVQLTLNIQHPSELILLFQHKALPKIEQLNVTNENLHTILSSDVDKSIPNIQLSKDYLREKADGGTHLRFLLLRYLTLDDTIILIGSLTMPLLENLILIDMYDDTLDHLDQFQEVCSSTHLPSLKNLYFSFCFPQTMEHEWRRSSLNCNRQWPFDNTDCYTDECYFRVHGTTYLIPKIRFIVYNCPINVLYRYKRTFHNYGFTRHVSVPIGTTRRRLIQWTCDEKYEADQLNKTLRVLASGRVNELHLTYLNERTNISKTSNWNSHWNLSFNHIRSITFNIKSNSIKKCQRIAIVTEILDTLPNLSDLVVAWKDFGRCLRRHTNLRHVHLILNQQYDNPKPYFNIHRLTELAPHLNSLTTSDAVMMLNENLIEFILNIIRQFDQLVNLILNKNCRYRSKDQKKLMFIDKWIEATHDRIFHSNNIHFEFRVYDELRIWL